ncbi:MAG TPA: (deoxy)nucleoside triphosphate pyrophosphohydrolase [Planctomycetaceae bacterium]|nr:(deoxy)nucleoside triphosphate pyrophosphohydrolase [Planctomycetaceae bacterium]
MTELPPIRVGIAVVQHRGCYLVGTRGPDAVLPGLAEFPGGKCHPNESPAACAVRECHEETGLKVVPVQELLQCQFEYPHGRVDLHFWLCRLENRPMRRPVDLPDGYRWLSPDQLTRESFPEANEPVIRLLLEQDRL